MIHLTHLAHLTAALFVLLSAPLHQAAPAKPAEKPADAGWKSLFDGKTLGSWKKTGFSGGGEVRVERKFKAAGPDVGAGGAGAENAGPAIVVGAGESLSGFNWIEPPPDPKSEIKNPKSQIPRTNYEIELEALKIEGNDFLCGLTFPVADSYASLILGGWGGTVVGISSIDNLDASENSTTKYISFTKGRWYKIRLRVTPAKLEVWLDDKQIIDQNIAGKKVSLRFGEIELSKPLGIATYQTSAAFRGIRIRRLLP